MFCGVISAACRHSKPFVKGGNLIFDVIGLSLHSIPKWN